MDTVSPFDRRRDEPHPATTQPPTSLSRRRFLGRAGGIAGGVAMADLAPSTWALGAEGVVEDGILRDRLWMWGHDAGSLRQGYGIGGPDDMQPGDALEYMGIPNVCMVRFTGTPLPPFDAFVRQFDRAKRLTWSFVDGAKNFTTDEKKRLALELAGKQPNLVGLDMDDFFLGDAVPTTEGGEARANLTVQQVADARRELKARTPPLDLSLVLYSNQLHPAITRHVDLVDAVYFWTWRGRDLERLEANFRAYRALVPRKKTLLGIYMWDFGDKKPLPVASMESQCRLALEWLKRGDVDGLIFHCTPLCGMKLDAVEWSREWIARHADQPIQRRQVG